MGESGEIHACDISSHVHCTHVEVQSSHACIVKHVDQSVTNAVAASAHAEATQKVSTRQVRLGSQGRL